MVVADRAAIFAREPDALMPVIAESCRIKASIVEQDEREAGLRRILNFGHTAGHALEAVTQYRRFRHGEAVGYGMLVAADLARRAGRVARRATTRRCRHDRAASDRCRRSPTSRSAQVLEAMQHDKKVVAGRLHFVLPTAIGSGEVVDDVTEDEIDDGAANSSGCSE